MRLVFCRTANRLAYLAYVTRGLLRLHWSIPGIDLDHSTKVSCAYRQPSGASEEQRKIYVEADGEQVAGRAVQEAECAIEADVLNQVLTQAQARFDSVAPHSLVLGGEGWKLRTFYVDGGLKSHLVHADKVDIMTLEAFVARANQGKL